MGRGILIQESFYEAMKYLPDQERLELFDGICAYSLCGTVPENLSPVAKSMFILMRPNIDSSAKKYSAAVSNGKQRSKKNSEANEQREEPSDDQSNDQNNNQCNNQKQDQSTDHDYDLDLDYDSDLDSDLDLDSDSHSDSDLDSESSAKGSSPKKEKKSKHKYGEYENVLLTDEEAEKLRKELSNFDELVQRLSEYIASTGKKYKSHYATLRTWNRREPKSKRPPHEYPEDDLTGIL